MAVINDDELKRARQGWIKYTNITTLPFSGEFIVTFDTPKGSIIASLPSSFIDKDKGTVSVSVIAEREDLFLAELPAYTRTTGSQVWFPKQAVLLEGSTVRY